jgi:hypothetical protein
VDYSDEIAGEIYKKNKSVPTEKEFITLVSKAIIDSNKHSKMIGLMNDPDFLPDVMSGYRNLGGVIKKFPQPKKNKPLRESVRDVMYRDYLPEGVGREDQKFLENQIMNRKGIQVKKIEAKTSDTWVCTGTDASGKTQTVTVTITIK